MNASITKCATVERAREVVKKLHERNRSTWNDLDRETVFAINALVSEAERLRNLYSTATAAVREALAQQALDKMAENARELGLDYEPAQQEPVAWPWLIPSPLEQPEPVHHAVIAGALFDFMGWLTSRKERIVLSGADEAGPAVDAIRDFAKMRGLSLDDAKVQDWQDMARGSNAP